MKTKLEIIEETVKYYSEDTSRRAFNGRGCEYLTKDGRMCAVGRCLSEEGLKKYGLYSGRFCPLMIEYMKEEYKISDEFFWKELQHFHDANIYWNEMGLSEEGEDQVRKLKILYKE